MLVANGKELNLSVTPPTDKSERIAKERWELLTSIEKFAITELIKIKQGKSVTLKDARPMNQYALLTKRRVGFDVSGRWRDPDTGSTINVMYCTQHPRENRNGNKIYQRHHYQFFDSVDLKPEEHSELIFMVTRILTPKKAGIIIENKQEVAQKKVDMRKNAVKVEDWIMNRLSEKDIRRFAYRWSLSNVDGRSMPELQEDLLAAVKMQEERREIKGQEHLKRGYSTFLKEVEEDSDSIKVGAYFNQALKEGQIQFDQQQLSCLWTATGSRLGPGIPAGIFYSDKEEYMIDWLVQHPEEFERFKENLDDRAFSPIMAVNDDYKSMRVSTQIRKWALENLKLALELEKIDDMKKKIDDEIARRKSGEPALNASAEV